MVGLAGRWLLAGALAGSGCTAARFHGQTPPAYDGCALAERPSQVRGRIGVVADSQFNTLHSTYRTLYRRRPVDRWFDVAIRPPALDYTSHYLLRSLISKEVAAGAEVVFFLGDGANNGCADELVGTRQVDGMDGVLTVLRQARARFGVPIFFVIGNHDYLGAGNTSMALRTRHALCNSERDGQNAPLTKLEVMGLIHAFNGESAALADRWAYVDSWDPEALARACNGGRGDHPRNQQVRRGCWLAGHLRDAATGVEYLLVDSNDYADETASLLFVGRRGGVSFRRRRADSQLAWLRAAGDAAAKLRVVLSHYDVSTLNASDDRGRGHARLRELVAPGRTVWLSGHTHRTTLLRAPRAFARRPGRTPAVATEYNVGSATDYPAYGLVADTRGPQPGDLAGVTTVFAAAPERCEQALEDMSRAIAGSDYFAFRRHTRGLGLFGLDFLVDFPFVEKEYRHRTWSRADDEHVRANLRAWLAAVEPARAEESRCGWPAPRRGEAGACAAMFASLQEGVKHGWAPITCDECRPKRSPSPRLQPSRPLSAGAAK